MSDPNNPDVCKIPGNPDIAGIGVRSAVYLQAALAVLTFGYLLRTYVVEGPLLLERYIQTKVRVNDPLEGDPPNEHSTTPQMVLELEPLSPIQLDSISESAAEPESRRIQLENDVISVHTTHSELHRRRKKQEMDTIMRFTSRGRRIDEDEECLKMSRDLGRSVILIGAAVLVSSLLQAKTRDEGLSHYHTLIILNISWINNWCAVLLGIITKYLAAKNFLLNMYLQSARNGVLVEEENFMLSKWRWFLSLFLDELMLVIHVYVTCALGLWFWAKPNDHAFTKYISDPATNPNPCRVLTYYWVFKPVSQGSRGLRIASLTAYAFYTFIHLPGYYVQFFGMAVPILAFFIGSLPAIILLGFALLLETVFATVRNLLPGREPLRTGPLLNTCRRFVRNLPHLQAATRNRKLEEATREGRYFVYSIVSKSFIPLFIIGAAPFVWFVVATEQLISHNSTNVLEGELDWTYGQTLALFSAIVAAASFAGSLLGVIKERRQIQMEQEMLDIDEEKVEPSNHSES